MQDFWKYNELLFKQVKDESNLNILGIICDYAKNTVGILTIIYTN